MCATCGCSDTAAASLTDPATGRVVSLADDVASHQHEHEHDHPHSHDHDHTHPHGARTIQLEQDVLAHNDALARHNREQLAERRVLALNLMSSPGAGKTTLLVRTITDLRDEVTITVVEGDQETLLDAQRIGATAARVLQVNTGSGCHLDAAMMARAIKELDPPAESVMMIENVGNLVCPALFDLGESARVVVMSVTEGADKPLKYPQMFRSADLVLLNKVDLAPYVDFDESACRAAVARANPRAGVLNVAATTGEGLTDWYDWLRTSHRTLGGLRAR